MALVTRLSRLFEADFHALLDRIEEPDLQLKQAVREMQFALEQDQQRLSLLEHEGARIEQTVANLDDTIMRFDAELDLCLAADKDDLARDLVRRKLAATRQLQSLQQQATSLTSQQQQLSRQIDEQNQILTSMQQKLELLVKDENSFAFGESEPAASIRSEEIEIALLREKERRAQS